MKATLLQSLVGIATLALGLEANAGIVLSLEPDSQSVSVGTPLSLDLVISGLGDYAAPSLGAFDLDLSYNSSILSASSVTFGSHLNVGFFGSIQNLDLGTPGAIHLDEVSLASVDDLQANQPTSFILATLGFSSVAPGSSAVEFADGSLSDEGGKSLAYATTGAQVEVSGNVAVPDQGSTLCLLALAALGLLAFHQRAGRFG